MRHASHIHGFLSCALLAKGAKRLFRPTSVSLALRTPKGPMDFSSEPPAFLLLVSCFFALQAHFTTNSILRFLNFPSSVSFVAIGIVSPKPFATIVFPSTPCWIR